jgi:pSer/pThr/pTyr-binding forkhead associated (FHA) protein
VTADDIVLLVLRLALVLALYLFLIWAIRALSGDLRAWRGAPAREAVAAAGEPPAARLVLLDGTTGGSPSGKALRVQEITTVGRAGDNALVLDDEFISAHHAVLRHQDGEWWLSDLGSTNGTWADNVRVDVPTAVQPGATIQFGRLRARFEA